jgi:hypothetical protein
VTPKLRYTPRPPIAVAAFMLALCHRAGDAMGRELWLVDLLACATYGVRGVGS